MDAECCRVVVRALLFGLPALGCGGSYEMELISGGDQGAAVGRKLDIPVDVFVTQLSSSSSSSAFDGDEPAASGGGPAVGVEVQFDITAGGGSVDRPVVATDADGRAVVAWTVGDVGPQELTVTVAETNVTGVFTAVALETGSFTDDRDGTTYRTVTANGRTWLADHLRYDIVGSRKDPEQTDELNGRLYTFPAAMQACPNGWHLPTVEEYLEFAQVLAPGENQGKRLRNDTGWLRLNGEDGNGSNSSAFNLLPAGYSDVPDFFSGTGAAVYLWTSSEVSDAEAQLFAVLGDDTSFVPESRLKVFAVSVRCVTD
jgi:uncharacterized protein (TIGR02145 family)